MTTGLSDAINVRKNPFSWRGTNSSGPDLLQVSPGYFLKGDSESYLENFSLKPILYKMTNNIQKKIFEPTAVEFLIYIFFVFVFL